MVIRLPVDSNTWDVLLLRRGRKKLLLVTYFVFSLIICATMFQFLSFFFLYTSGHRRISSVMERTPARRTRDSALMYEVDESWQNMAGNESRVIVWIPHSPRCRGNFVLYSQAADREAGKPALLIREVALDRRHVTLREYRIRTKSERSFRRIVVLLTAVPHGTSALVSKPARAGKRGPLLGFRSSFINKDGQTVTQLRSGVDYVITDRMCARSCKDYTPCRNKEWQMIITVSLRGGGDDRMIDSALESLENDGGSLHLVLPVVMRDNSTEVFETTIGLSCIAGLTSATAFPASRYLPPRRDQCKDARGALAVSGGPLFGEKRMSIDAWREIAHYAARCLYGSMWFDSVAVGVIPEFTLAQIEFICSSARSSAKCMTEYYNKNVQHLKAIAATIEDVFEQLQIPSSEWSRLILFSFCRLGSDFGESELGTPCNVSHHHGQKPLGHIAYTMFGQYHKWVSNLDLDEFVVYERPSSFLRFPRRGHSDALVKLQSAESQFDRMMATTGDTSFRMPWFDFRVTSRTLFDLSYAVTRDNELTFGPYNLSASEQFEQKLCYMAGSGERALLWGGGKVVQHCEDGFGFMVHDPFNMWKDHKTLNLNKVDCTRRIRKFPPRFPVYTYHARLDYSRYGKCEYQAQVFSGS